jgi:hypothetical protein
MNRRHLTFAAVALLLTLLAVLIAGAAAPQFIVDGSTTFEQNRVARIERSINFTQVAMPDEWEVTIWPQERFDKFVHETKTPTSIAFTYLGLNHTYINEYFLIWATDEQIQFVLAHEAGHMICECRSEAKADAIARVTTGHSRPYLEQ